MEQMQLVASVCPYCGCGCGLYIRVEDGIARNIEFMEEHPVTGGALCPKGNAALEVVYHAERLRYPMKRLNGDWVRISWEEALGMLVDQLTRIKQTHGADALGFLASAKCTNEENYLFQKLARLIGTNNIDHCARLCHAPTVTGLVSTLGSGAMTNPIPDIINANCILIIGANPAEDHPIVSGWIWDAKERGAKVIVVDPRYTPTAWMADTFVQLKPGTDIALINGIIHVILKEGLYNKEFLEVRTTGFAQIQELAAQYDPATVEKLTGVPSHQIQDVARLYAKSAASAIVYCMGITQHSSGHQHVISLSNLALLCGHIGRPGTGMLPLRGQNNVQGACDMGGLNSFFPGYLRVTNEEGRRRLADKWGARDLPGEPGLTVVEMINAAGEGKIKGMYIMGENPVISDPDSNHVEEALSRLEFLAVQDLFLSETAKLAHLVLPAASWAEKEGSFTGTERRVQWMHRAIEPQNDTKTDWQIISETANKMGFNFNYAGPQDILREINEVVPIYAGIIPERIQERIGGITWPCPTPQHPGTPILHVEKFATPDGMARFIPVEFTPPAEETDIEYPLLLTTGRVVMHYNSGSMTRRSKALLTRSPGLFVEINPGDAATAKIKNNEEVRVLTKRGEAAAIASVTDKVPPGIVFVPFHFAGANALTISALDPVAKIPEYKVAACRIEKRS